ncbi:MAG: hypothetical protein HYS73_01130 [Parcubacteria group bacterium]|nr:hypothetical protein [Parcubacteria group bacterium]MBI2048960.1 hypothetical protein [Parcubacteria group bacterium]
MPSCTFGIPYGTPFSDSPLVHFGRHPGGTPTLGEQGHKMELLDEQGRRIVKRLYEIGGPMANIFIGRTAVEVTHGRFSEEMEHEMLRALQEITGTQDIRVTHSS